MSNKQYYSYYYIHDLCRKSAEIKSKFNSDFILAIVLLMHNNDFIYNLICLIKLYNVYTQTFRKSFIKCN